MSEPSAVQLLLVDDDLADVELMKEALQCCRSRPKVSTFETGEELLERLNGEGCREGACLILLDLNMPGIGGRETLRRLKTDPLLRKIPVIVLTSSKAQEDVERCYELGANCYVIKPLELSQLETVAKRLEDFWVDTAALPAGD